ncbi:ABC transporter ATP-binding protein [Fibrisoma montanum]|uniref:ABC transporter ATP-binding protein n=1 Tax=Fibrisoma montanum TaxID=2305895 RepID=A0A418MEI3_9BACT|nr:ABC transporter ATP-binding protein [Fibrisoma montanum]RIV25186.1 ABC transporter ATP-binding protein [Fibrisoma montanum]
MSTLLSLRNVSKFYPAGFGRVYVLRNINLDIAEGEFISIMGPSGSGKSTLLHILGLLEEPSEGEYLFQDEPVQKLSEKKRTELHRTRIGFVFQAYHLIDELTVYENIETPLLYKGLSGSERKSRVAELLDRFNMVAKKDLFPTQLSGGQQQLVGIARALAANPKVIFADEPTGNLHSDQARDIMELFRELNQKDGVTIVQVTHSEVNAGYGNRILTLKDGWLEPEKAVLNS